MLQLLGVEVRWREYVHLGPQVDSWLKIPNNAAGDRPLARAMGVEIRTRTSTVRSALGIRLKVCNGIKGRPRK